MAEALVAYRAALALDPSAPEGVANALHAATWIAHWRGRDAQLRAIQTLADYPPLTTSRPPAMPLAALSAASAAASGAFARGDVDRYVLLC